MVEATRALREKGFNHTLELQDNNALYCPEKDQKYSADELEILEFHRFEGDTNPSDMSVIFAIEAQDGTKGTIITPFGVYADRDLMEFLDQIPIRTKD